MKCWWQHAVHEPFWCVNISAFKEANKHWGLVFRLSFPLVCSPWPELLCGAGLCPLPVNTPLPACCIATQICECLCRTRWYRSALMFLKSRGLHVSAKWPVFSKRAQHPRYLKGAPMLLSFPQDPLIVLTEGPRPRCHDNSTDECVSWRNDSYLTHVLFSLLCYVLIVSSSVLSDPSSHSAAELCTLSPSDINSLTF